MSTSPLPVTDPTSDPPSTMSRPQRLMLAALLYCTQNLSLGMFTYAVLAVAQANGVSRTVSPCRHRSADFTLFKSVSGIAMAIAGGLGIAAAGSAGFVPITDFAALLAAVGVLVVERRVAPVLAAVPSAIS